MIIRLTDEQSIAYLDGGWEAYEVEETSLEDVHRRDIRDPVAVILADGCVAFDVTPPEVIV